MGPWIKPSQAKYAKALQQEKDLMYALIEQLPPFDYFYQRFHHSITNWLPFFWKGFTQTTKYTYSIDDLKDPDKVWSGFQAKIRTDIRKAEKVVKVRSDFPLDRLIDVVELTFKRQSMTLPFDRETVRRLDAECQSREIRKMFFAEDAHERIHAVLYLVWDEDTAYYLMAGADPELRSSGASSLLVWEALKYATTVTLRFDFEGGMIEPVERFFRGFGARQVSYFQIENRSRLVTCLSSARKILRTLMGKTI